MAPDPDPASLPAIVNKNNFLKHNITEKKFSWSQINSTREQKDKIYIGKILY